MQRRDRKSCIIYDAAHFAGVGKVFSGTWSIDDLADIHKSMRTDIQMCGYAAKQVVQHVTEFARFGENMQAMLEKGVY